jgi:hypothetical protein
MPGDRQPTATKRIARYFFISPIPRLEAARREDEITESERYFDGRTWCHQGGLRVAQLGLDRTKIPDHAPRSEG